VEDVVPAARPITVFDLLTSRAGYGFPSDFTLPAVQRLFPVQQDGREPQRFPPPGEWMAELSHVPMLYQPGEAWLYDTCSVLQGVLITRAGGQSLPAFLDERVFQPLGMVDTGFSVSADEHDRLTSYYRVGPAGSFELADGPDGQWRARRHRFHWVAVGWSERRTTGWRLLECCWREAPASTADGCCQPIQCSS
jgi:CubicO group peptidase (beta-lactamase class C family)